MIILIHVNVAIFLAKTFSRSLIDEYIYVQVAIFLNTNQPFRYF